jgi:voltage-gated potassium channel
MPGEKFYYIIAISGIGVLAYTISNVTALVVEGEVTKSFRRKRMEKLAQNSNDHYIVCGIGDFGIHIINELRATKRAHVIIELNKSVIDKKSELWHDEIFIEGDASDNDVLLKAGIHSARGLFAVTDDDNLNLVISLTAKQLSPHIRVVAQAKITKTDEKNEDRRAIGSFAPTLHQRHENGF